ncbi:hypothetical protein LQW54_005926 [Pestalotiopsis sp. IQ-011]
MNPELKKEGSEDESKETPLPFIHHYGEPVYHDPRLAWPEEYLPDPAKSEETEDEEKDVEMTDAETEDDSKPKPWETLVIGADLGENKNLSKIRYKDREILQQKFIIEWTTNCDPENTEAQQKLLEKMTAQREAMEADPKNHLPADQLRAEIEVPNRLKLLRSALQDPVYQNQKVNIVAAIQGYHSGKMKCSENYTLLYAGEVVDTCPSYQSFAVDRRERIERYCEQHGDGWLWWEPPLAEGRTNPVAKKGFCLYQSKDGGHGTNKFNSSPWSIHMRFVVDEAKVKGSNKKSIWKSVKPSAHKKNWLRAATFKVMLDSGASYPLLLDEDFDHLGIPNFRKNYAPQSTWTLEAVGGSFQAPYYDLDVGLGASLHRQEWDVLEQKLTGWPHEEGIMGGLTPVAVVPGDSGKHWEQRLSGVMPFIACYTSSVPTMGEIWMGEERRDVVGARRFSPFARHTNTGNPGHEIPVGFRKFADYADVCDEPDEMIFVHNVIDETKGGKRRHFFDIDYKKTGKVFYGLDDITGNDSLGLGESVSFGARKGW